MSETDKEILEARKKLAEKFGNTQLGGRGTQKRKKEPKHRSKKIEADKKVQAIAKKSGAKKINEVSELNIFRDDNTVLHFKKPSIEYSYKEKVTFLSGVHEVKSIKDLLPGIMKQIGPKQFQFMKDYAETLKAKDKSKKTKEKIDEAPELVEDFEEVSKGKEGEKEKEKEPEKNN